MKKTIIKFVDIIISFYLFLIYIIVMLIFHKNPYEYYKNMINTYLKDDNNYKSSFSKLYDYLYNSFIKFIIYR